MLPVGANEPVRFEGRVLAASNKELPKEVEAGRFREDLYYRLNVVCIPIPPLRDRREDIPVGLLLAKHHGSRQPSAASAIHVLLTAGEERASGKCRNARSFLAKGRRDCRHLPPDWFQRKESPARPTILAGSQAIYLHSEASCGDDAKEARRLGIELSCRPSRLDISSAGAPLDAIFVARGKAAPFDANGFAGARTWKKSDLTTSLSWRTMVSLPVKRSTGGCSLKKAAGSQSVWRGSVVYESHTCGGAK